jgi:predicted ester cyclase
MDKQETSTFDALVSPRVVVEVGSSAPIGLDEWRANLEAFYRGFPDGRHVIEELLVVGSHGVSRCRFVGTHTGEFQGSGTDRQEGLRRSDPTSTVSQGDMAVAHRGQMDMHGLFAQLDGD